SVRSVRIAATEVGEPDGGEGVVVEHGRRLVPGPRPAVVGGLRDRRRWDVVEVQGQVLHGQVDGVPDAEHAGRFTVVALRIPEGAEFIRPRDRLAGQVVGVTANLVHHDVGGGYVHAEAAPVAVGGVEVAVLRPARWPQVAGALGDDAVT